VKEDEVVIMLGDRRYRVRGLDKNAGLNQLKVNVLVSKDEALHVDSFDLYAAKARYSFIRQASIELGVTEAVIKKDLVKVLLKAPDLMERLLADFETCGVVGIIWDIQKTKGPLPPPASKYQVCSLW
jgi:hypothetical protein